jgi:hypothetical protein
MHFFDQIALVYEFLIYKYLLFLKKQPRNIYKEKFRISLLVVVIFCISQNI